MHNVVTGRALRRSSEMSSPHSSQMPKVPSSILANASLIFPMSFLSRSRIRRRKLRSVSRLARSVGSGKVSLSLVIPVTVFSASSRRVFIRSFKSSRKYSSLSFSICLPSSYHPNKLLFYHILPEIKHFLSLMKFLFFFGSPNSPFPISLSFSDVGSTLSPGFLQKHD